VTIDGAEFRGLILLYATSKIDIRLSTTIFRKLISLPVAFFERNLAGVLSKHMQQDQRIREFLSGRLLLPQYSLAAALRLHLLY